jgi:hypothetical protein
VHVVSLVDFIHTPGVEENQQDKNVYGALLCEPEAELESGDGDPVHLLYEQNAENVRTDEPDGHAAAHEP